MNSLLVLIIVTFYLVMATASPIKTTSMAGSSTKFCHTAAEVKDAIEAMPEKALAAKRSGISTATSLKQATCLSNNAAIGVSRTKDPGCIQVAELHQMVSDGARACNINSQRSIDERIAITSPVGMESGKTDVMANTARFLGLDCNCNHMCCGLTGAARESCFDFWCPEITPAEFEVVCNC